MCQHHPAVEGVLACIWAWEGRTAAATLAGCVGVPVSACLTKIDWSILLLLMPHA